jgi:23S rRNA (adenine2503-C2)-methyltransferase
MSSAARLLEVVQVRRDEGVVKLALGLDDGAVVECALIPGPARDGRGRLTLCLSTQVGCRMGCHFCATGGMGLVRDLTPDEIVGQAAVAERLYRRPDNLVFMGMGEPLDNLEAWHGAVRRLIDSRRVGDRPPLAYSTHQMTVSTCGHVAGLEELARRGVYRTGIAVSVNAPNDAIRSRLMPVNRRWPMAELREALLGFPLRNRVFLAEYVLFRGINDARDHALELAAWLAPFRALVNVIAYNPVPGPAGAGFERPEWRAVELFTRWLVEAGVAASRRESKGRRIGAACGQLASPQAPQNSGK